MPGRGAPLRPDRRRLAVGHRIGAAARTNWLSVGEEGGQVVGQVRVAGQTGRPGPGLAGLDGLQIGGHGLVQPAVAVGGHGHLTRRSWQLPSRVIPRRSEPADGRLGPAHRGRDLGHRAAPQMLPLHGPPLVLGQLRQGGRQSEGLLVPVGPVARRRVRGRQPGLPAATTPRPSSSSMARSRRTSRLTRPRPRRASAISQASRRRSQPASSAAVGPAELVPLAVGLQQGLLHEVGGVEPGPRPVAELDAGEQVQVGPEAVERQLGVRRPRAPP